ncbi:M28 family peptidase [Acuticoccus sediminis]|uniref:M28 family peptidase n=1 Tax=Acuticoccus sediminis TaxID=2184697 RepID=UPI001CFEA73D|nr:M28 family peptidase [Acuticoccus sediminis]
MSLVPGRLPHAIAEVMKHVTHMNDATPYRKSGSGQDTRAGQYVVDTMTSFGLDAYLQTFETYDSDLGEAKLEIVSPEHRSMKALACAHIEATPEGGYSSELVDVGPGGLSDYEGKDVRGKIVLAEVSYAPSTPEKARIAAMKGAAGILLMNWGLDDGEDIPWRGLKSVWGNPTPETWKDIPRLFGISISRRDGIAIREMMKAGPVTIKAEVTSIREWRELKQPICWLRAPEYSPERDQFIIVSGHIDSWNPGLTDNITGDAVMMEIARVLAERRDTLRRSVVFCFWNGHEVAEAAGSTYFVDSHWEQINRNAVAYLNIDSVGMKDTNEFHADTCPELSTYVTEAANTVIGDEVPVVIGRLDRFGDQSFFGVGVSAFTGRHGFSPDIVKKYNGATIGWYNHTEHDTIEILDTSVLERDLDYWTRAVAGLATATVLPQRFSPRVADLKARFARMLEGKKDPAELTRITAGLDMLEGDVAWLDAHLDALAAGNAPDAAVARANALSLRLTRQLTFITGSACGKYGQDSYGVSTLHQPVPLLASLNDFDAAAPASLEAKLLTTKLIRLRQTVTDAIEAAHAMIGDLKSSV